MRDEKKLEEGEEEHNNNNQNTGYGGKGGDSPNIAGLIS